MATSPVTIRDALDAQMLAAINSGVESYTIADGRSVKRINLDMMLKARAVYAPLANESEQTTSLQRFGFNP